MAKDREHGSKLMSLDEIRQKVAENVKAEEEKIKGDGPGDGGGVDSAFIRKCLNNNEQGDGVLFGSLFRDRFLYNKAAGEWLEWQGNHWQVDVMNHALACVGEVADTYEMEAFKVGQEIRGLGDDDGSEKFLKSLRKGLKKRADVLRTKHRRNNVLDFVHTSKDSLSIRGDELDSNPYLFAFSNCVMNLKTGETRPGKTSDYLLRASPIEWKGLDEPCPLWESFLLEIFEDDEQVVEFIKILFGYAMIGACIEHKIAVLEGRGRNGKGTIVQILMHVMGDYAAPIRSEMLLSQPRNINAGGPTPDIMSLRGLRMAFASETEENCRISTSRVKWLTGNDKLTGRNPHDKHETVFNPSHTLFLMTNNRPQAPAEDFAFWQRMILIPFNLSYVDYEPEKENERRADPDLPEKLKAEASGILAWLVKGCLLYQKYGLKPPQKVKQATAGYQLDEDNITLQRNLINFIT